MQYYFNEATLIRAIRKLYGYSQEEFCVFLGYSQATLSKIENALCSPDIKFVIALSQKINIDLNIFKFGFVAKLPEYLKSNKGSRFLQHTYLEQGIFSAKTTYLLLELIQQELGIEIYKKLGITKDYFVFSELKYSPRLFRDILKFVEAEKVIQLIKTVKSQSNPLLAEDTFKQCILSLGLFELQSIVKDGQSFEVGLNFDKDTLFSEDLQMKEYFKYIISFHVLNELNVNVSILGPEKKSKFDIVLRLNAS